MRTSSIVSRAVKGSLINLSLVATLATCGLITTTGSVSLQDIADLTNTRTSPENRWLAYLVNVPSGSEHVKIVATDNKTGKAKDGATSKKIKTSPRQVNHVVGVQTSEALHILDRRHILESGEPARINRALKGDRVFTRKSQDLVVASLKMVQHSSLVTPLVTGKSSGSNASVSEHMAKAQTFDKLIPAQPKTLVASADAPGENSQRRDWALAKGQLNQARIAARAMEKVANKVRREEALVAANPAARSTVSAYARQDNSMESAFAAVLRPTLQKEEKKKVENKKAQPNGLQEAVASLGRSSRRVKIRLSRGDHKWAAKPLPRVAFSSKERRCLASGVYFEARGEPIKGQKAVAQVILNRVKNPSYPGTICGVVYQNKWRRNRCQFSFACDGKRDRVKSHKLWKVAVNVSNDAIDGRYWLISVGSSSHYHADYVWPRWRRKMRKMTKIGRHIFYRTRNGGWS